MRSLSLAAPLLAALALTAVSTFPTASACSLAYPSDFEDAWVGEDRLVANLGTSVALFPFDAPQPRGVADLFFPSMPRFVVDPEMRYVVYDDQDGLGADCSGRRYSQAIHANGTLAQEWRSPVRPVAALPQGFVSAPGDLRDARLIEWGTWRELPLDLGFLPEGSAYEFRVAASRDGSTLAFATREQAWLHGVGSGRASGPIATTVPGGGDVHAVALSADGSRVAVVEQHYTGAGTSEGEHEVLRLLAAQEGDSTMQVLASIRLPAGSWWRSRVAWHDGQWAVAAPDGVHLVPQEGGKGRVLSYPEGEPRSVAASSTGTWFAVFTTNGTQAAAIHLYGPGWLELRTLQPQAGQWQVAVPSRPPPPPEPTPSGVPGLPVALLMAGLFALALARRRR